MTAFTSMQARRAFPATIKRSSPWIRGAAQSGLALLHLTNQLANFAIH